MINDWRGKGRRARVVIKSNPLYNPSRPVLERVRLSGNFRERTVELADRVLGGATVTIQVPGEDGHDAAGAWAVYPNRMIARKAMRAYVQRWVRRGAAVMTEIVPAVR